MEIGLALPQYDYAGHDGSPLEWDEVSAWARRAEDIGFDGLWLADHLFMSIEKYGGPPGRHRGFDALVALSALTQVTTRVTLGPLVLAAPLRSPAVTAKVLAALDVAAGGRLIVGVGAGWLEDEFGEAEVPFRSAGARLRQLGETIDVFRGLWTGGPFSYAGRFVAVNGARCLPTPGPRAGGAVGPPIWVGGRGDRLLEVVARRADGWNTVWQMTPDTYRQRLAVLARACEAAGRDPATVTRSLGLYTLVGDNDADLDARFRRMRALTPPGVLDGVDLDGWRQGRLVGTVEQVREQAAEWAALGVDHLVVGLGAVPFTATALDDLDPVIEALAPRAAPATGRSS